MPDLEVTEVPERERYEATLGGELAGWLEWRGHGANRALTHTEVLPEHEHQGVGSALVREVLARHREQGLHVIPMCPFVRAYLGEHPEELDVVEPHVRAAFGLAP